MHILAPHIPALLSFWLLAAHALRQGQTGLTAAWALLPLLFLLRRAWVRRAAQAVLAGAILFWAKTGGDFIRLRLALEEPWLRMAAIIGGVILVAAVALVALESARATRWHKDDHGPAVAPAAAFLLTAALLSIIQINVARPMLLLERFWPGGGWLEVGLLSAYAAWLVRAMLSPKAPASRWRRWRVRLWGLFSLVFFGQLALGMAGLEQFLMTGTLHMPVPALIVAGPLYRGEGFFMPILFGVTLLLAGPAWCSFLCYIGAWDGQASKSRPPHALPAWRTPVRLGIFVLVIGAAIALRAFGAPMTSAVVLAAGFGLAGVAVMLIASRRMGVMVHCTTFCPIGVLSNILGKVNPLRIRVGDGCTNCGACIRVCRYDALSEARLERGNPGLTCTLCGDCVSACAHSSMRYHFPGLSAGASRALFLTLVVSFHAVFLGVARI